MNQNRNFRLYGVSKMVALLSVLALLIPSLLVPAPARASYNCINPHCYGINQWSGARGSFWGSSTTIRIPQSSSPETNSHLTNEMWLLDTGNSDPHCVCWIEVGEFVGRSFSGGPVNTPIYFWYDNRPVYGGSEHYIATIPGGNFGYNTDFEIYRAPGNYQRFEIYVRSSAGDVYPVGLASVNNAMQPTTVQIGEEIYGTNGAYSEQGRYTYNKWIDTNGNRYYQTNTGDGVTAKNPPYAGWGVNELPSQSSVGGAFYADTH